MKQIILWLFFLCLFQIAALSQAKSKAKKHVAAVVPTKKTKQQTVSSNSAAITLNSTGTNSAKAGNSNTLLITDPILTTMEARANGSNVDFGKSPIVGMSKHAYGFAKGHISLMSTGSTTFGTQTGSGAVGTGTSLGTFGSVGPAPNANGKSPYAGINMWGNAMNMTILNGDSLSRFTPAKKH